MHPHMQPIARREPHVDRSAHNAHQLDVLLQHVNQLGRWSSTTAIADAVDLRRFEANELLTTLARHGHIAVGRVYCVGQPMRTEVRQVSLAEIHQIPTGHLVWLGIAAARQAA